MSTITVRIPELTEVKYEIEALEEHLPVKGNVMISGNDEWDKEAEDLVYKQLEYTEWAWCCVKVTARWKGLEGTDYLGGCSYKSEEDFRKDGYYEDMCSTAYDDLVQQINALV